MSCNINRRDFLKIGGISTGVAIGSALVKPIKKASALPSSNFKYRDRSDRYPWWVKTVDTPTDGYDLESIIPFTEYDNIQYSGIKYIGAEKLKEIDQRREELFLERIQNNVPGYSLRDNALKDAMYTYFDVFNQRKSGDLTSHIKTPQDIGAKRWEGSEEDASDMIEAAAKLMGVEEVCFSALEPKFLYDHVKVSSSVNEITNDDGKITIPERFKYVISLGSSLQLETVKRSPSYIGGCSDIAAYKNIHEGSVMLMNYIKALGYQATILPGLTVPHAILAGMGELGRTNRLISPIYGGAIRIYSVLTDLPLALDKPIDFGLQEFCKGCKICAEACPSGALSLDDDPSFSEYPWSMKGKKAYHEDEVKCISYLRENTSRCSICTVACPWTRPMGSALHDLSGPIGATIPSASSVLAEMHHVFGFGLKNESESQSEWWKLDLPPHGFGNFEGK